VNVSTHEQKVQAVVEQIRKANTRGVPVRFVKKSVSHFVPNPYEDESASPAIDLSPLCEVLSIDPEAKTAVVESGITLVELVAETMKYGLVPYTVSELKTITVGGAISGCSVESMSYRYGGLHDSCLEYEVITGTGEVVILTPEGDPELFHMMHGSYGTLGVLSQVTLKLYPARPYVKVENRLHTTFAAFWADLLERCERADFTFVDGIIHGSDAFVLCLGEYADEAPYTSDYEHEEIYYKSTLSKREDYMTASQYFFRYDTECHWLSRTGPGLENRWVRKLFGRYLLGSTNLIQWSNRFKGPLKLIKRRPELTIDVFIPEPRFEEFFAWYEDVIDFYPLWIVPYRMPQMYAFLDDDYASNVDTHFVIDAAIYGRPNNDKHVDLSEVLEHKVHELNGFKTLISRNHYTEEEFWRVFDRPRYDVAKARLDPEDLFGNVYQRFAPSRYGA
jgi:FAD/FMN-containing dehydrogenase